MDQAMPDANLDANLDAMPDAKPNANLDAKPNANLDAKPNAKPKSRCAHPGCRVKLTLMRFSCKCNKDFCLQHRYPDVHNCSVDYLSKNKDNSKAIASMKCVAQKTVII